MCNVKYIVKPETNLVVCEIREDYGTRFRGIAKCNPTDTFNEETGKKSPICAPTSNAKERMPISCAIRESVLTSKLVGSMTRNAA